MLGITKNRTNTFVTFVNFFKTSRDIFFVILLSSIIDFPSKLIFYLIVIQNINVYLTILMRFLGIFYFGAYREY